MINCNLKIHGMDMSYNSEDVRDELAVVLTSVKFIVGNFSNV